MYNFVIQKTPCVHACVRVRLYGILELLSLRRFLKHAILFTFNVYMCGMES